MVTRAVLATCEFTRGPTAHQVDVDFLKLYEGRYVEATDDSPFCTHVPVHTCDVLDQTEPADLPTARLVKPL